MFTHRLRELANPVRDRLEAEELAERATNLLDDATFGVALADTHRSALADSNFVPLFAALDDYNGEQRQIHSEMRGNDPFRFEMSFVPDPHGSMVGAMPFYDSPEFRSVLDTMTKMSPLEDYSYWNSSDRPDEVSEHEWNLRRGFWERTLGDKTPSEVGVGFALRPTRFINISGTVAELLDGRDGADMLPTIEDRSRRIARRITAAHIPSAADKDTLMRYIQVMTSEALELDELQSLVASQMSPMTVAALRESFGESNLTSITLPEDVLARYRARVNDLAMAGSQRE